ncbi:MAG: ABC transporter ATP-binding protein [Deltaproteobacteria bacterium]|nr:ABC transporter ATP-binding protein [Deltaproteobacteria bacterium]
MLRIENLSVRLQKKIILKNVCLQIPPGEVHALFGPNGSGKTTLLMTIMGFPEYEVISGRIIFQGEDITSLSIDERARRGIGLSFQRPPTIKGLKTRHMLEMCNRRHHDIDPYIRQLHFQDFLSRDINQGFSGGEIKKSELLQLLAQHPLMVLLDEPESGVDLENISIIGDVMNQMLQKDLLTKRTICRREIIEQRQVAGLIITHTGYILNYIEADRGHVMIDGSIACAENPREILRTIKKVGYEECVRCLI